MVTKYKIKTEEELHTFLQDTKKLMEICRYRKDLAMLLDQAKQACREYILNQN